jgi:hypothetical protein
MMVSWCCPFQLNARTAGKAVDIDSGKELYTVKTPSGIIGNVTTYEDRDGGGSER